MFGNRHWPLVLGVPFNTVKARPAKTSMPSTVYSGRGDEQPPALRVYGEWSNIQPRSSCKGRMSRAAVCAATFFEFRLARNPTDYQERQPSEDEQSFHRSSSRGFLVFLRFLNALPPHESLRLWFIDQNRSFFMIVGGRSNIVSAQLV